MAFRGSAIDLVHRKRERMMASGQGLKKGVQKSKFRGENTSAQKCTERGEEWGHI
jgi:hypothetical protein